MSKVIKGYKATDKKGKCRDFQFKVGKTYEEENVFLCSSGFHFCLNILDVYNYYPKSETTRVFEIEALGETKTEGDKSVTSKIKIVRELEALELLKIWINKTNSGDRNSGYGNSGDRNSGDWNSGYGNSGNRNSGDWNSGDGNSGYFNTKIPVYFFNKPSKIEYSQELESKLRNMNVKPILQWIGSSLMTEQEKNEHPEHKVTEGFLRKTDRHDWSHITKEDKKLILSLPNYDDEVFKIISNGISLLGSKTIKVNYQGQDIEIDLDKAKELGVIK